MAHGTAEAAEASGTARPPSLAPPERAAGARRGVPDPGIELPKLAVPTMLVWFGALLAWFAATAVVLGGSSPWRLVLTIPVHAFVSFAMFTVLHESIHHAAGRWTWVNAVFGRLSIPFVSAWGTYPMVKYLHIEHHRNTNEDIHTDPDAWTEAGPAWQLPFRWLTMDVWYFRFYLPRISRRPRRETWALFANVTAVVGLMAALVETGHGWQLVLIYLIPQRLGIFVLAWWFDWLPHHDLGVTAKVNRFGATRVRVGWEAWMSPLMFNQNYHLVHHIHPTIPFYRYVQAWKHAQSDYLDRKVPIATAWGTALTASEYLAWRELTWPDDSAKSAARFHPLTVAQVRPLTSDAVAITFDVPEELRDTFSFRPGQHLTVRTTLDGESVRRCYSICAAAGSGTLQIAVKKVAGGRFSTFANTGLQVGDTLDVLPPAGNFTLPATRDAHRIAAVAAGSGITPVISILASALSEDPGSSATLLYLNRDAASTMFADEISRLVGQSDGRLRVLHFHTRPGSDPISGDRAGSAQPAAAAAGRQANELTLAGRPTPDRLVRLLQQQVDGDRSPATPYEWYLCGPDGLAEEVTATLAGHGVPRHAIHRERFLSGGPAQPPANPEVRPATVHVTLGGTTTKLTTDGAESVLDGALRSGVDAPYSCTGGACATCTARLVTGSVHMEQNYALSSEDVDLGWVLTCQARPTSETLHLSYDD